ncbi:hypothetical protein HYC85_021652 [Camellia sinensis]|uniref:Kinesin motor domain-containing protein n=1 Tax=Camellia sinensis TaxID=4442 RepID=A0A7J7GJT0_CAMSI|nr:hypothetical protein HYC85_021652 [Camellia sinensis]
MGGRRFILRFRAISISSHSDFDFEDLSLDFEASPSVSEISSQSDFDFEVLSLDFEAPLRPPSAPPPPSAPARLLLESFVKKFILELKSCDIGAENTSDFIYNYAISMPNLAGFWCGNVPALLMVMPYTAIQFTVLHKLKTFATGSSKTAGCATTVGSYPFDLLRTSLASCMASSLVRTGFVRGSMTQGNGCYQHRKLCMREDGKQQVCIVGLQQCKVSDVETIQELIEKGNATRSAGTTGANEESSRSHAILQLAIKRSVDGSESKPPRVVGKLSFIDLAGILLEVFF